MTKSKENLTAAVLILFIFLPLQRAAAGEDKTAAPRSNLLMIENCVGSLLDQSGITGLLPLSRPLAITAGAPGVGHEIGMHALSNYFKYKNYRVFEEPVDSAFKFSLISFSSALNYGGQFRERLFGDPLCERNISVEIGFSITDGISKEIVQNKILNHSLKDTIYVGMIGSLEDRSLSVTLAPPPEENFLDRIVEPFLILGATGAAVYLFYHVRTK